MSTSINNTTTEAQVINAAASTEDAMAGNFYGGPAAGYGAMPQGNPYAQNGYQMPYGQVPFGGVMPMYQPAQSTTEDPRYFQGAGYSAANPADFGFAPQQQQFGYGNTPAQGAWNFQPAQAVRGVNTISEEDKKYIKELKDVDFLKISREDDIQARCMHKTTDGPNKGFVSGAEAELPGSWHCNECDAKWMIANCPQDDFDKLLSTIYNIIQTDKAKMTNCSTAMTEIFKTLPVIKLYSKIHKIAESDFNKSQDSMKSKFQAAPGWGGGLNSSWINQASYTFNTPQAPTAAYGQPGFGVPQQPYGQFQNPGFAQPYAQPGAPVQQNPYGYGQCQNAGYAQPYGQGAPVQQAAPVQPGCASSPLVSQAAPAAPAGGYAPTQQASAPDVAGATTTTEQKI